MPPVLFGILLLQSGADDRQFLIGLLQIDVRLEPSDEKHEVRGAQRAVVVVKRKREQNVGR